VARLRNPNTFTINELESIFQGVEESGKAADSWGEHLALKQPMSAGMLIPVLLAVTTSAIAFYFWRATAKLKFQLRALGEKGRKTESENAQLRESLAARRSQAHERIARLEHDLKSPLGVVLGFSTLLGEFAEKQPSKLPALPLRCVSGIEQASRKMLRIIEAAAQDSHSEGEREAAVMEGKAR